MSTPTPVGSAGGSEVGDKLAPKLIRSPKSARQWGRIGILTPAQELSELEPLHEWLLPFRSWCSRWRAFHPNTGRDRKTRFAANFSNSRRRTSQNSESAEIRLLQFAHIFCNRIGNIPDFMSVMETTSIHGWQTMPLPRS
jgi:hypothetical protein